MYDENKFYWFMIIYYILYTWMQLHINMVTYILTTEFDIVKSTIHQWNRCTIVHYFHQQKVQNARISRLDKLLVLPNESIIMDSI